MLDQDKLAYSVKVSPNKADYDMLAAEAKDTGLSVATVARMCLTEILPIVRKRGRDKRSIARMRSQAKGAKNGEAVWRICKRHGILYLSREGAASGAII